MKQAHATPEVLDVMQVLWGLAHALEARSKRMQRDLGITGPQRLLLRVVGELPGCGPGVAATRLRLDPGTVSRLAVGLERRKLVRREPDEADGRKQRLVLTARGKLLNRKHRGTVEGAVREALDGATPSEVRSARKFIRRLTQALTVPATDNE
jgi:MarR family transcriptional regulator, organic hydroperoxide resistance regulator